MATFFYCKAKDEKIPIVLMYSDNLIEKQGLIGNFIWIYFTMQVHVPLVKS